MGPRHVFSRWGTAATAASILFLVAAATVIVWPTGTGPGTSGSSSSSGGTSSTSAVATTAPLSTTSTKITTVTTPIVTSSTTTAESSSQPRPVPPVFQRVVAAKVYQDGSWTLPGQTPTSAGRAIAGLDPTYVEGVIRLSAKYDLTQQQIEDFNWIRDIVLQASPSAKFAIELDALQYNTSAQIVTKMQMINGQLHPDSWFFDFYEPGYLNSPSAIGAAISYAHSQGQLVGGSLGAGQNKTLAPPGSDFVALADSNFTLSLSTISSLKMTYKVPVLVHLDNTPPNGPTTESCVFMDNWTESERASYVTTLAAGQSAGGYEYMYNVFFPECPARVAYDSLTDGAMYSTLSLLVSEYNS